MARLKVAPKASGHSILVVDDDGSLTSTLYSLLQQEGHTVYVASNGTEALDLCKQHEVHLMLLDYFMPGMTGADVVKELRRFNQEIQVMLQTGYSSDKPPRQMLRELDIQAYHDKSEGPEKMLVLVDAALKMYRHVRSIRQSQYGLQYILEVTPQLYRLQPLEDLLQGVLMQIQGLMGYAGTLVATLTKDLDMHIGDGGALVATAEKNNLKTRITTGRFRDKRLTELDKSERDIALKAIVSGQRVQVGTLLALPLVIDERKLGVILVDNQLESSTNLQLLDIFIQQATVAIENVRLYELATVDELTRLSIRRHWLNQLEMALRLTVRYEHELCVLVLDIDHFKNLNDSYGHLAGDMVLKAVGQLLLQQARKDDFVGRYGGEEMIIALPHTSLAEALVVGDKLRKAIEQLHIEWQDQRLNVTVSIGISHYRPQTQGGLPKLTDIITSLIEKADQGLYAAKKAGRNRVMTLETSQGGQDGRVKVLGSSLVESP
ncbi:MAG: diguanylate cyclase [Deinococcales bacterium]